MINSFDLLSDAENLRNSGNAKKALELYSEVLFFLKGVEKIDVLFEMADIYAEMGEYFLAKNCYNEILKIDQNQAGAWYGLAFTNENTGGDVKKSLEFYKKAIDIDPNYKEAYYYMATIFADIGNTDEAKKYLKICIDLDGEDFTALNDLGSIYENENTLELAEECIKKSIEINGNYYLSHFNLGVVYKKMNRYGEAISEYEKAAALSDNIYIYLNMSAIFIEKCEFEKSIEILTQGIDKNPHHILYYNRACSYSKLGEIKKAREDFENARKIDEVVLDWAKDDPDLKDIIG